MTARLRWGGAWSDALARVVGRYGLPLAIVLGLLGLWQLLVWLLDVPVWKLPSPWRIAEEMADSFSLLMRHARATLVEILVGFAAAVAVGLYLALAITSAKTVERAMYPIVVALQTVPVVAIAPLLVIWFGFGLAPKVIVIALAAAFPVAVNAIDGLRSADPDLLQLARSLGATRWRILMKVQVPASLPQLFTGLKIAAVMSVIGAVLGEWVGADEGLAYLMRRSTGQFLTARVFAAVVVLSLIGVALFFAVAALERRVTAWRQQEKQEQAR